MAEFRWFGKKSSDADALLDEMESKVSTAKLLGIGVTPEQLKAATEALRTHSARMVIECAKEFLAVWEEGLDEGDAIKMFTGLAALNTVTCLDATQNLPEQMMPGLGPIWRSALAMMATDPKLRDIASAEDLQSTAMERIGPILARLSKHADTTRDEVLSAMGFKDIADLRERLDV